MVSFRGFYRSEGAHLEIGGRYRLEIEIARGSSGAVHRALDTHRSTTVALKILDPGREDAALLSRNEFALLSGLRHPNLVQMLDIGQDPATGSPFLSMEYVEGTPLLEALGDADEARALDYLIQAARALGFVHSRGLLHRDIKPANLLVGKDGVLKLVDFGLASEIAPTAQARAGTFLYVPPEVIEGAPLDARSDLYSLGLSFYHAYTGVEPFRSGTRADLLSQILEGHFPPDGGPSLPALLGPALLRLAARRPADRFASAGDLIRHLDLAAAAGLGLETPETERSYLISRRMVGRSRESERLTEALVAVTSEHGPDDAPSLLLIGGEAGIGKSRLLGEFRREAVLRGVETHAVACPEGGAAPLQPFALIVRALAPAAAPADTDEARAHARLSALLSGEDASEEDIDAPERRIGREKSRVFDQVTGWLLSRAAAAPLVLVLEDLHWADDPTLELLGYLARNARGSRLLVVASHRGESEVTESFGGWIQASARREWSERLLLERLGEEEVRLLLGAMFEGTEIDPGLARTLARESGGNPLFLLEILRSLQSENALARTASGWRLPEIEGVRAAIPEDLDRALARRIGRVEGDEGRLLGALAVLARPVGPELAAEVSGIPEAQAADGLEALAARGLLARTAGAGGRYVFEHALVRRAAEERLDPEERRRLHRRAGETLERDAPGAPGAVEQIARHYAAGGPPERALVFAEKAGDLALSRHAGADAARHYESALSQPGADAGDSAGRLRLKAGNSRLAAGDHAPARAHFETLLTLTAGSGDRARRATALERLGTVLGFQRTGEEGTDLVEEALALFRELGDLLGEARALHNLATRHARQSRYAEALPRFLAALEIHERRGDIAAMADERNSLGLVECFLGRYDVAADHLERGFELARSVDYRYLMAATRHNLGIVRRSQGRYEDALASVREALAIFDEIGHRNAYGFSTLNLGIYGRAAGHFEDALATFRRARAAVARAGDSSREVYALECEADLLRFLGQPLTAIDRLGEAIRVATRASDERQRGYATAALSRALLDAGRTNEALERARTALAIGEKTECPRLVARALVALAAATLASGQPAEAAARARELLARSASEALLEEMAAEGNLILASAAVELLDPTAASRPLEDAGEVIRARGLKHLAPLELRTQARVARALGNAPAALSLERRAADERRAMAATIADETLRRSFLTAVTFEWPRERKDDGSGAPSGGTPLVALQTLYEISGLIGSGHGLDELLDRVLDLALGIVRAARGLIILIDESSGALEVRTTRGVEKETARDAAHYSQSIVRAAGAGESILSTDAEHDERFSRSKSISLFQIKSLMCVPLRVRQRTIGTVYVDGGGTGRIFTRDDISFLEAFASQAAIAIENARLYSQLAAENELLKRTAQERYRFENFIGASPVMRKVFDMMERAAASPLPVLIEGESGTGKELVARALHFNSPRRARVFLSENCAAIPEALLESELFGYAQGAFTGADRDKKGLYEMADGGTLFLDEIGDMPFAMQAKLLRVLQDGEYRPIGGKEARKASVRILAATNADLRARIADGRFREDLYYRLNVISISLPPLRVRKEDIPALATHFLEKAARDRGLPRMTLEDELLTLLVRYNWPGNVRQLENVISRLGVLSRSAKLTVRDLESDPSLYQTFTEIESPLPSPIEDLSTLEKRQIQKALHETKGNRVKAAALIGISRATIFRKIKEYRIE